MLGYALAVLIGISLGLLGGGGSILTVPTLVYVMNVEPKAAIAMSLPIVGLTSLTGAYKHWRDGNVDFRAALGFGIVAMVGSLAAARAAKVVPGIVQLTLLGVVMLVAAVMMMRRRPANPVDQVEEERKTQPIIVLVAVGLAVGALTGLVGIGGGFLFVPALHLLGGLPMKKAVGSSLIVIAMNTAGGAIGYHGQTAIDWHLVGAFAAWAILGSIVGAMIVGLVSAAGLRKWFAWFLVVMAAFILWQNRAVILNPSAAMHPSSLAK